MRDTRSRGGPARSRHDDTVGQRKRGEYGIHKDIMKNVPGARDHAPSRRYRRDVVAISHSAPETKLCNVTIARDRTEEEEESLAVEYSREMSNRFDI